MKLYGVGDEKAGLLRVFVDRASASVYMVELTKASRRDTIGIKQIELSPLQVCEAFNLMLELQRIQQTQGVIPNAN